MKKRGKIVSALSILVSLLIGLITQGCTSNVRKQCFKVRLGISYCGPPGTVLAYFEGSNRFSTRIESQLGDPVRHVAAISGFPESLSQVDSVFYVHFRYDKQREEQFWKDNPICTQNHVPVKILIFEGISSESCQPLDRN